MVMALKQEWVCVVTWVMDQQQSTNTSGTDPATSEMKTKHGKYNFSMVQAYTVMLGFMFHCVQPCCEQNVTTGCK